VIGDNYYSRAEWFRKNDNYREAVTHEMMEGCEYINPDVIAQEKFGGWVPKKAIIEVANYAQDLREKC